MRIKPEISFWHMLPIHVLQLQSNGDSVCLVLPDTRNEAAGNDGQNTKGDTSNPNPFQGLGISPPCSQLGPRQDLC